MSERGPTCEELAARVRELEQKLEVYERERTEHIRNQQRLERAQEVAKVGNWEIDLTSGMIWGSAEACRIYGVEPRASILPLGRIESRASPEDRAALDEALRALVEDGTPYDVEFTMVPENGGPPRRLRSVAAVARDANGQATSVQGVVQDVTERTRAEETSRKLSQAVEQSPTSIVITDRDGCIEYVNPKFTELTGYSASECVGKNPRILKSGQTPREVYTSLWTTILAGREWRGDLVNRKKDGTHYRERAVIAPILDRAGVITHFVSVNEDVTAQHFLEEQFRQAQKMESVGRVAGGVAHDFNNILSVVLSYASVGLDSLAAGDPLRAHLQEIIRAGRRASELTRQLLAFSRRQVLRPMPIDLNRSLSAMEGMLRRVLGEDIELRIVRGADLWPVLADPGQIEQVVMNLVVNARDAMPEGGELTLSTENVAGGLGAEARPPEERFVQLTIRDTGVGMDTETQARVFEPFFTTKEVGKGTGLGLSMVYGIVQQSGGSIAVRSRPGGGTTFEIRLPSCDARPELSDSITAPLSVRATGETVLVTEDDPAVRTLVVTILRRQGFVLIEAGTPEEALSLAEAHSGGIHLLLTDVVLPRMKGPELAARLKANRPEMRVLYMSGYGGESVASRGVLEGGAPFLAKPITPVTLIAKVREVLGAR